MMHKRTRGARTPLNSLRLDSLRLDKSCFITRAARAVALCLVVAVSFAQARAQTSKPAKLPSPDRVVGDYVKAVGGKKRLAALRDATYEWDVRARGAAAGTARTLLKRTGAMRSALLLAGGSEEWAANPRSAWTLKGGGRLQTLTDAEAFAARLRATLEAAWFVDYKKQKVLARTAAREELAGESAYVVEFTTRGGARLRYWFGATSKLLLQMSDDAGRTRVRFADWRSRAGSPIQSEPHRMELERAGEESLTLTLRDARYNTGLADSLFEPPVDAALDVAALLRDLERNQQEADKRVNDYTFTRKITEREMNDRGVVKKEKVSVYEVYPFVGYGWVQKLVSENGVPLSPERAAKEEKRTAEELEKAEREGPKLAEKRERKRAERRAKRQRAGGSAEEDDDEDEGVSISTFLKACELISPRREHFRGREVIVFDFRPRAGFRPSNTPESIVSKLSGVMWVDPTERQVMRLEARLVDSFKMGGGLVASIKPGSAFVFERTRLEDGVWLPRFSQINMSARVFLVAGMTVNEINEFSDYKRFTTQTGDDKLDAPKEKP